MCGIAGFFNPSFSRAEADSLITKMLYVQKHRGPDFMDSYLDLPMVLGHNRLSIIDLSSEAHQPMAYNNSVMVLNGEIYNYRELRKELEICGHQFRTDSDTEVVLVAWEQWGEDCVNHFIGMWALALWDTQKKTLFCSRDRFGIKPFGYIHQGNQFFFASEYKALRKTPAFVHDFNVNQIARGLNLGWPSYQDETYFQHIKNLPAGSNLLFDGEKLKIWKYWEVDIIHKTNVSNAENIDGFLALFKSSIDLQMRSDVKLGICLSGGLDSSSILSMISNMFEGQSLDAFTIYYDGKGEVDERPWAAKVFEKFPQNRWHTYQPTDNMLLEAFEQSHYHCEVPLSGSSAISQYFVMKMAAKENVKVLLDGQGADEYLAGYMHAFDRLIGQELSKMQLFTALKTIYWHQKRHKIPKQQLLFLIAKSVVAGFSGEQRFFSYAFRNKVEQVIKLDKSIIPFSINGIQTNNSFDHYLYHQVFTTSLPSLLHYEDRNSMAFGIESRVPFLDHRLVQYCFQLGNQEKIKDGETKSILRNAMTGILPDDIRLRQDKKGFVTPGEDKWLRGPLRFLLDVDFKDHDFIDNEKVKRVIKEFLHGGNNGLLAWRLASLHHWMKMM